jgi:hypothetical protein
MLITIEKSLQNVKGTSRVYTPFSRLPMRFNTLEVDEALFAHEASLFSIDVKRVRSALKL